MRTVDLSLDDIDALARRAFVAHGCDDANTQALVRTVVTAERDGSLSHGLFRVPGYIASLQSGKVNGTAAPRIEHKTPAAIHIDGDGGYAPLALERGVPVLADAASKLGIAVMTLTHSFHFAALWPEVEALAQRDLFGLACVCNTPIVAPHGGQRAFFGTNPIACAWPRPGREPVVFDMATSAMAQGEVQVGARDGRPVPAGTGLDAKGQSSTDPKAILDGVLLPFGGHKGSAIALLVELLAAGATGERFSVEAGAADNGDGGPARGGQFIVALSPSLLAGENWAAHSETFLAELERMDGVRLPGARRWRMRTDPGTRAVNAQLVSRIKDLGTPPIR